MASRFDVAELIVKTLKPSVRVVAVDEDYFASLPARRVRNEILHSRVSRMRPWNEALVEYLETEWKPVLLNTSKA